MICYADRTFCKDSKLCDNKECADRFTDEDHIKAVKWWGDDRYPISMGNYRSNTCGFIQKGKDDGRK